MLTLLDILLIVLCAHRTSAGPLPRYLNTTSVQISSFTTYLASPSAAAATPMQRQEGVAVYSEPCDSMTLPIPTSSAGASVQPNATLASSSSQYADRTSTLTLYTTRSPSAQNSGVRGVGSVPTSQSSASLISFSFSYVPTSGTASASETWITSHTTSSSSTVVTESTSSTYMLSSQTLTVVQSTSTAFSPSKSALSSAKPTLGHPHPWPGFAYPLPDTTKAEFSSAATTTADAVWTTRSALPPVYSWSPTSSSSLQPVLAPSSQSTVLGGLPSIVTQQPPSSSSSSTTSAISTTSGGIAGITIVPVNTAATTIYITVTTTDAGVTTTVAEQTVTATPY